MTLLYYFSPHCLQVGREILNSNMTMSQAQHISNVVRFVDLGNALSVESKLLLIGTCASSQFN